jgi:hypothetical protein
VQGNQYTNRSELYYKLGLTPQQHCLFEVDHEPEKFDPEILHNFGTVFLLSGEGNTQKYYKPEQTNWHYFDSTVSDQYLIRPWMFHFSHTVTVNTALGLTDQLSCTTAKPLVWDALLGLERPHRDLAYQRITQDPVLRAKTFLTYYNINKDFIPGFRGQKDPIPIGWSSENIVVDGIPGIWRSQIIPTDIYNQTWFSLVCETRSDTQGCSFFTEKIAKPMLAGRPFVVLADQNYLRRLRSLGFQTFESVFDQSYDSIEDNQTRWNRALDLMQWISDQDPEEIYQRCQQVLLHNQQLIKTNWENLLVTGIQKILTKSSK